MIFLNSGEIEKIGLAAKWCPSIDPMFEKSTFLCESIAKLMFPRESYPEYEGLEEAHYIYSQGQPEEGGPSTAADEAIQEDVHEARQAAVRGDGESDGRKVAELQWKRMVEDLLKTGKLENCIAFCDISASTYGIPLDVSVALGILTSELSREPWKGKVITFSESPMLHLMEGDNLASKETDYKAIKRTFRDARYGDNAVWHTVFWKLRDLARLRWSASKTGCPCQRLSKNMFKLFLDNDGHINPECVIPDAGGREMMDLSSQVPLNGLHRTDGMFECKRKMIVHLFIFLLNEHAASSSI
ncbi:hypothetical protein SAY86_002859 [Trapa natans]|uniref:Uncharacterized protein n=1 Tax=Trapa natans TaxID=22666 RepID=A0AAN7R2W0_TRANT|nr:hypothetical protein SAY86_002859 [Trapa natans]